MAESPWSDEAPPPMPKKGVPTWVWFVGGGCLLMVLLGAGLLWFGAVWVKRSLDPDRQWPEVAKILPFDERPADAKLTWGSQWGMPVFVFLDQAHGHMILLMHPPEHEKEKLLDESSGLGVLGHGGRRSMVKGKLRVQGRDVDALRFVQDNAGASAGPNDDMPRGQGASILVDLTQPDADGAVLLQMTRLDGKLDAIADQDVIDFLKPFHVGPER